MDQDEYQQIYEDCVKDIKNQEITDAWHDAAIIYLRHIPDSKIKEISLKVLLENTIPEYIKNKIDDTDIIHITRYIKNEADISENKLPFWEKAKFTNFEWEEITWIIKDVIIHENLSVKIIIETDVIPWEFQWYRDGAELWTGDEQYQHLVHPKKVTKVDI
jgi:hypothetical protein